MTMKLLNPINHANINEYLLNLLDQCSSTEDFCASCYALLSDYLEIKNFIVYDNSPQNKAIDIIYQHDLLNNNSVNYDLVLAHLALQNNLNDRRYQVYLHQENYSKVFSDRVSDTALRDRNSDYRQWLRTKQINCLFLSDCYFQNESLAQLFVEIKSFKSSFSEIQILLKTVTKYLSLCFYHQQLQQKEQKLIIQKQQLTQAKTDQSQYLSHMNHELRTPIAAVIGFAKMLQQKLYGDLNVKQAQYVDAIYQSGTYLLELISDLLDVSKIQAQKEELFIEKILISELCESALSLVKTKAQEQEIDLNLVIKPNVEFCLIDQRRLKQVLVNLLSNAVKFTEEGSVTLEVSEDQENTYFKVIDTGIGIDPESQEKLFKPFAQLNTHIHRKHRGTGLGLVISRELARLHGGDIILESEANKGSCFTVCIPHHEV